MKRTWFISYNLIIVPLLRVAFYLAAGLNSKVRRGLRGRRNLFKKLEVRLANLSEGSGKRVWFHSSSLGEFEQAKPIIAELKRRHPDTRIIASFFSPSGYDNSRNYKLADIITYLPFDSASEARRFVQTIRPDVAVIVRYDVWPNHAWAAVQAGVPMLLANATMHPNSSRRFFGVRGFHKSLYESFQYILTVSERDAEEFRRFGINGPVVEAIGDTRFDQVRQRSVESRQRHVLPVGLLHNRQVFVVGSSWDSDEEVLIPALSQLHVSHASLLTILVPHEPTLDTIERIERELNGMLTSLRFSDLHDYAGQEVIIIDSIGILMALYQYAHVAYVGGSFRQGVHNVLEPAVYGVPVVVGPVHTNSQEAVALVQARGAFVVQTSEEVLRLMERFLSDEQFRASTADIASQFVERNTGATERFLSYLEMVLGKE